MIDQYALNMLTASGQFEEEKNYWLQKLQGELTPATFPYDYTAAIQAQSNIVKKSYALPKQLSERIFTFSNHSDYGVYMTILSAFPFLLNTYTNQSDLIIGSPVFRSEEKEEVLLNEMLPLRMSFDRTSSFKEMMSLIKETVMDASKNENFPLNKLIELLQLDAQQRNPLYRVVVQFDRIHETSYASQLDLDTMFTIVKHDQGLAVNVSYLAERYKVSTIDRIVHHLFQYLQAVLEAPGSFMAELDIVGEEEKQRLLVEFNDTQATYNKNMTIHHIFEQQVLKTPAQIAIVCGDEKWTYQELNEKANNLAHVLRGKGVTANSCVGVMTDRSLGMITSLLAILKAGGAYVPIDPTYPTDRVAYMIENSGAKLIVHDKQNKAQLSFLSSFCEMLDLSQLPALSIDNLQTSSKADDLAYIIYTSGTTGKPKGVMIEHRNVVRLFLNDKPLFDFNDNDVWTIFHSYCFDFSVWEMYGALLFGGKLVVIPKPIAQDPRQFLELLIQEKVTVLNQTPSSFYHIIQYELEQNQPLLQLRYVIFGGEALKPTILKPFKERYADTKLINMYGITETTVHVTYKEISDVEIRTNVSNIGKPIPTLRCYILDHQFRLVPQGVVGELYVGGEGVARGYIHNEPLTKEKFLKDPFHANERMYRTGDLAKWSEDGELEYYGRIDHQVKIRGHRIELGEIETKLLQHEEVRECLVIAREDNSGQSDLVAYYVANTQLEGNSLRGHLASSLPDYMIPAFLMHLEHIPLTANGKIDRKALPLPALSRSSLATYVAPHSPIEIDIAALWSNVLQVESIGIHDNFFTLGGDSIKVIRFISQLNKSLSVNVSVADFYKNPTIAELGDWLTNHSSEGSDERAEGLQLVEQMKKRLEPEITSHPLPPGTEDYYPLSSIQQSMVFYSKLKPGEPIYHDQFYYLLEFAHFDRAHFCEAVSLLTTKHPILRTAMHLERYSEPMQIVHHNRMPAIVLEDLTSHTTEEQELQIQAYMAQDLHSKFQFHEELLWRLGVFQLSKNDVCIVLSFHHAILDGWSVASFNKELIEVYHRLLQGEKFTLEPLKANYKDYVGIQLFRKSAIETEQFWNDYLAGYTRNKLPFNLAAKQVSSNPVSVIYRNEVDQELLQSLDRLTQKYGYTLREICFSAYLFLMQVITTEKDLVTGIVTHDRPAIEDGEKMLGCFLNTLPFRMGIDLAQSGVSFIGQVQQQLQKVITHDMQLVDIAKLIGEGHHYLTNPMFDALFNYTDFHILEETGQQSDVKESDRQLQLQSSEMTNTLFDLEVTRTWNQLGIQIKYAQNYFYESEIDTAFRLYVRILNHFVANPMSTLQEIPLLEEEERKRIVFEFNNTQTPYAVEKTMHMLFEEQVARTPNGIALTMEGVSLTYEQLNSKANQVAGLLISRGVLVSDHVALIAQRGFDMIIGMYGILKAGAAYVPIDPEYPLARKQYISEHAQVTALLADRDYGLDIKNTIGLDSEGYSEWSTGNHSIAKKSSELAYIIYTSGSTGNPKGVMIEHHSAVNLIQWVNNRFTVGKEDTLLFITSMCFDLSVYDIFGMLACGGKIVIARQEQVQNHQELLRLLQEERITFWDSVPSTMNHLVNMIDLEAADFTQTDLRLVFMSGDWIPVTLPERIKQVFPNAAVISLGGATEATVWSNYYPVEGVEATQSSIPYGNPMDNNYFYILDDGLNPVPYGVAGELYIGGVGVARGYMNDEEKSAAAFINNPFLPDAQDRMYRTGDLGRMLPTGVMEFLGRKDHQVKIRGFRVELGEIESQLYKLDGIREAVVVDKRDPEGIPYLCAYVVFDQAMTSQQLRDELSGKLPGYMVPSMFVELVRLPLTSNGKIDRKALPEPDESLHMGSDFEAPRDEIEAQLEKIWRAVLSKERVGIRDHFFEIGGHSLLATSLALKMNREFGVEIPLLALFNHPTIQEIAVYIREAKRSDYRQIERAAERDVYPMSFAQQRMFILNQIEGEGLHYNAPVAFIVEGNLEQVRLESALQSLLTRHEILRTSFSLVEGAMVQHVHPNLVGLIEQVVCEADSVTEIEGVIRAFVRPFEVKQAPLLRVGLVQWTEGRQVLLFDMHHMISDGLSMGILIREFIAFYEQQALPAPRIQYRDYAVWQQEDSNKNIMLEQEQYWLNQFAGELPVLNMPSDYARPVVRSYEGDRLHFTADKEMTVGLQRIAAESGSTLYMVLLAAYNVLLAKYSGQTDIVVGSPIAGRSHADLDNMLGVFINTLALRNAPKPHITFEQFLVEVKDNALQAYANQDYPFEQLVEKLNLQKDLSRNPLFDTMFLMQNANSTQFEIAGLSFTEYPFEHKAVKFDLSLQAIENANGIRFDIEYGTKLFKKETIARLSKHWLTILHSIIANPSQLIAEIEMVSEAEKEQIIQEFNDTKVEYVWNKTVHQLFEEQAKRTPDQVAIVLEKEQMTYRELDERSNQLAHTLRERGVVPDMVVGLMTERSLEMFIGMYSILKAGGAYLPMDPAYPQDRLEYMLQDSGAKLVLTNMSHSVSVSAETIPLSDLTLYSSNKEAVLSIAEPNNLAYVIYTSGSTGKPKGVMIIHQAVTNLLAGLKQEITFSPGEAMLTLTSISFDIFVVESLIPLALGMTLIAPAQERERDLRSLEAFITEHSVKMMQLTPSRLRMLIEGQCDEPLRELNSVLIGGEALPEDLLQKLKLRTSAQIYNMYGPTETTVWSAVRELTDSTEVYIGKPIANTQIYVLDNAERPQPIGVIGELCISGDGLARGYWNRPELTDEKFVAHPFEEKGRMYRTGDLAKWLPDGNLVYMGRIDHQVKIRGYRIELGEIEARLRLHHTIHEAVVIAQADDNQTPYLCAYVVADEELTTAEYREHLMVTLPDYMIPSYFIKLEQIPLTPNGKIDRRALPEPEGNINSGVEYAAPQNAIEQQLAEIWQELLNVEQVGRHNSFFEWGGHSLKAMVLVSRIHKELGVEVPVREVFQRPTIAELALYIQDKDGQAAYLSIPIAQERAYYPLSTAQRRMFILNQLEGQGIQYNSPNAFIMNGTLDERQLENAFLQLLSRHEILRTTFTIKDEQPVQQIHSDVHFSVEHYELDVQMDSEQASIGKIIQHFIRPFNLNEAPLWRVGLVKLSANRHLLLFDMHHIISDGVTMSIVIREFITLYEDKALPEQRIQYKDYATWQQETAEHDALSEEETYWLTKLQGEIPVLNLPTDYMRPAVFSYEGDRIHFTANKEVTDGLQRVAAQTGSTLYMVLLAAYNVLMQKYTNQEDIIVGTPIAGRPHADLHNMLGVFINTLAMRNKPQPAITFKQLLLEVKENALQAYANQDYPFEQLVEKLNLQKDVSRNPLFDTLFILQNMDHVALETPGLSLTPYSFDFKTTKYDLTLQATEDAAGIRFDFEYNTRLFSKTRMEQLSEHWLNLLQSIILDPLQRIAEIEIMSLEEQQKIVLGFNDTKARYSRSKTIHQLFEEQVKKSPDQVAIVFENEQLTYRELDERSNQLAHTLRERGVKQDMIVGLMAERSLEMFVGIYGILKAGGAYLPMDPVYPQERLDYMLQDSGAKLVLTHTSQSVNVSVETIRLNDPNLYHANKEALPALAKSANLAYIIYTSGSTGKPKGVMIIHQALTNLVTGLKKEIKFAAGESILTLTSISFDIFVVESLLPLALGMTLVAPAQERERDLRSLEAFITEHPVKIMQLTPSRLRMLLDGQCYEPLRQLSNILLGGEALPVDLLQELKVWTSARIYNMYGPTETTVWSAVRELTDSTEVYIGKPIANTQIYVLDSADRSQPIGVVGELCIAGNGLARGYWNRPDLTDEKFVAHPFEEKGRMYRTGDLARWLPDGNLVYMGRIDHQVKIRGYRIELGEIEARLRQHSAIQEAVVIAREEENKPPYLCAYLVTDDELTTAQYREHLILTLPDYMIPSFFIRVEHIPLTPNGKIDRSALPEPSGAMSSSVEYVAPRNELESKLVEIWADILELEKIGVNDDFFELGGNSIQLVRLHMALEREELLPERDTTISFQYRTIAALACYIESLPPGTENEDEVRS